MDIDTRGPAIEANRSSNGETSVLDLIEEAFCDPGTSGSGSATEPTTLGGTIESAIEATHSVIPLIFEVLRATEDRTPADDGVPASPILDVLGNAARSLAASAVEMQGTAPPTLLAPNNAPPSHQATLHYPQPAFISHLVGNAASSPGAPPTPASASTSSRTSAVSKAASTIIPVGIMRGPSSLRTAKGKRKTAQGPPAHGTKFVHMEPQSSQRPGQPARVTFSRVASSAPAFGPAPLPASASTSTAPSSGSEAALRPYLRLAFEQARASASQTRSHYSLLQDAFVDAHGSNVLETYLDRLSDQPLALPTAVVPQPTLNWLGSLDGAANSVTAILGKLVCTLGNRTIVGYARNITIDKVDVKGLCFTTTPEVLSDKANILKLKGCFGIELRNAILARFPRFITDGMHGQTTQIGRVLWKAIRSQSPSSSFLLSFC